MKAGVLYKAKDLRLDDRPTPDVAVDGVLVKIRAVGICGSDMHLLDEGRIGNTVLERPVVLGHEAAGDVVEVGDAVESLKPGDRVAIEPGIPCRSCAYCKRGEYHLCPDVVFHGVPHNDGFFAEYATVPADFAFKLPDSLSYVDGAMLEPLAVGLQGATEGEVQPGQTVAILGAGPIGLSTLQACVVRGATRIIVVDVVEKRLQMAKTMGATDVIDASKAATNDEIARLTGGFGVDVALETAGAVPTIQQSLSIVRRGGIVVLVGICSQAEVPLDVVKIVRSRLQVRGCFRYVNQYPVAVALAGAGKVDVSAAVTNRFKLDQLPEAIDFAIKNKDIAIKSVVEL